MPHPYVAVVSMCPAGSIKAACYRALARAEVACICVAIISARNDFVVRIKQAQNQTIRGVGKAEPA